MGGYSYWECLTKESSNDKALTALGQRSLSRKRLPDGEIGTETDVAILIGLFSILNPQMSVRDNTLLSGSTN